MAAALAGLHADLASARQANRGERAHPADRLAPRRPCSGGTRGSRNVPDHGRPTPDRRGDPGAAAAVPEAREITAEVSPYAPEYAPEIERCYLERLGDARRAGRLDLTFVVGREGDVVSFAAAAPSLPPRTARQVETCIRAAVSALRFPERRNDTTAIVPFYFQHTNAPGAGPKLSCWNPRGC